MGIKPLSCPATYDGNKGQGIIQDRMGPNNGTFVNNVVMNILSTLDI